MLTARGATAAARLRVEASGPLTLVVDRGRHGLARLGIAPSGPFDLAAHTTAAATLGNHPDAAGLEVLLGGLVLRVSSAVLCCVTGAAGSVRVNGLAVALERRFAVPAGGLLEVGPPERGLRRYVAIAGGLDVAPVLGSRSRDTLAALGPPPLTAGDELAVGSAVAAPTGRSRPLPRSAPPPGAAPHEPDGVAHLALLRPPRRVPDRVWAALTATTWSLAADSDRVAVRLTGAPIPAQVMADLAHRTPSEPLVAGAVQLPPAGIPLVFGPDHPLTGGYPVVGVLTRAGLDRLAQLRPGDRVRLTAG